MDIRKLKKQAFWIALGVSVAGLLGVYGLMVMPRSGKIDTLSRDIQSITTQLGSVENDPVGQPDIAAIIAYGRELGVKLFDTVGFFSRADESFETWFSDFQALGQEAYPEPGAFMAKYIDSERAVDAALNLGGLESPEYSGWRENISQYPIFLGTSKGRDAVNGMMKDLQKMHWIRSRFAKALAFAIQADSGLPADEKMVKVKKLLWVRDVYDRWGHPPGSSPIHGHTRGFPGLYERPEDFQLPGGLGSSFTFCAEFTASLADLPKVIRDFVSFEPRPGEPAMLVELMGITVRTDDEAPYEKSIAIESTSPPEQKAARIDEERRKLRPRSVRVLLSTRIFDPNGKRLQELKGLAEKHK